MIENTSPIPVVASKDEIKVIIGSEIKGNSCRVKIVKNKVAPPFRMTEFDIMYGEGISKPGDILDCAVDAGIIEKSGSWFSYMGERIGQGRENIKEYLRVNPVIMSEIEAAIKDKFIAPKDENLSDDSDSIKVDEDGVIID